MGRGIGDVQRRILAVLPERPIDTFEIAALVFDVPLDEDGSRSISDAQRASVARALNSLQSAGKVVRLFIGRKGRAYWGTAAYAECYRAREKAAFGARLTGQQEGIPNDRR